MKHPPYHLRTNKAIDRLMFMDAIACISVFQRLDEYVYYGLGGPYLEDFRLVHERFPEMRMVSIEKDEETFKRQQFHLPCRQLKLRHETFHSFLAQFNSGATKCIFWLDYTDLEYSQFGEFQSLLGMVPTGSLVKITLRAEPEDFIEANDISDFRRRFSVFLPSASAAPVQNFHRFATLLQKMLQIAAEQQLPHASEMVFQPLTSFCYKDGVGILTLTGVVCLLKEAQMYRRNFAHLRFANLSWRRPRVIDVPFLSTKERMHLQKYLPCESDAGQKLLTVLGYELDKNSRDSLEKMRQYGEFYRYYPYFMRVSP